MAYLCIIFTFLFVVALPFAAIKEQAPRARLYLLTCAAPAGIHVPVYLTEGVRASGYGTLLLVAVSLLLSLSLTLVGAVLLVAARRQAGLRRDLAVGVLIAALPMILTYLGEQLRHG